MFLQALVKGFQNHLGVLCPEQVVKMCDLRRYTYATYLYAPGRTAHLSSEPKLRSRFSMEREKLLEKLYAPGPGLRSTGIRRAVPNEEADAWV